MSTPSRRGEEAERDGTGAVGIYHETYVVPASAREAVYGHMPPHGLAKAVGIAPRCARGSAPRCGPSWSRDRAGVGSAAAPGRREGVDARTPSLVGLAALLSAGHHVDHVVRGTQVGWPLTAEVTPFTVSLVVYPLLVLGLPLSLSGGVGPGYWLLLSGPGAVFVGAVHVGPTAVERPGEILARTASRCWACRPSASRWPSVTGQ